MDEPSLVSIIIPCYNQARFLSEAILSVERQTYPHHELIVIDDGSADDSSEVAQKFENVNLIRQPNAGLAAARNLGFAESTGKFIVFLDADDRLLPDALAISLEAFRNHAESAFVSGFCRFISAEGEILKIPAQPRAAENADHYLAFLKNNYIWCPASVMYRREILEQIGCFDSDVNAAADYDLYLRISRRFPVFQHGKPVAEYRRHRASMSSDPELMLQHVFRVFERQKKHVETSEQYRKAWKSGVLFYCRIYAQDMILNFLSDFAGLKFRQASRWLARLPRFLKMMVRDLPKLD